MSLSQAIIDRYFANAQDIQIEGEAVPHTSPGNKVEYLIDGESYFSALSTEIEYLKSPGAGNKRFFYFANWWAGLVDGPQVSGSAGPFISAWIGETPATHPYSSFVLGEGCSSSNTTTGVPLIDHLGILANNFGVDVRSLVWMAPMIMREFLSSFYSGSGISGEIFWFGRAHSLRSTQSLRNLIGKDRVCLNVLAHPIGAWHVKMVVCGDDNGIRAYVGGMDMVCDRNSQMTHPGGKGWHDASVKVEGPAAIAIFDYFQLIWNEQRSRRIIRFLINGAEVLSHYPSTLEGNSSPVTAQDVSNIGTHKVQVLRTFPNTRITFPSTLSAMNVVERSLLLATGQQPLSFAPDGLFEFRLALHKAISSAESYVYIEDEAFMGREIMEWLNVRLKQTPNLKVIMLWGSDPGDPENTFVRKSIETLTKDLSTVEVRNRVVFYEYQGVTVHSKIFIIDDIWASIGTANCARRSLYMDGELTVSVLDEATPTFAQKLRKDLWAEHCDIELGTQQSDLFLPLEQAIGIWESSWASAPLPPMMTLKTQFEKKIIPFEYIDPPGPGQWASTFKNDYGGLYEIVYDFFDGDSR